MAFTETFTYTAGQTDLYAYPASASYALSSTPWTTHRVLCTEVIAGYYSATMDESKGAVWSVFDGSAVPTTHDDAIATIRYESIGGGSSLTGANTVTITVQYASLPVEGAKVRLSRVGETGIEETDADGEVAFSANDGTWTVAITKPGFQFTPTTLEVNGDEIVAYTLTAVSIPASDAGKRTVYYTCYGSNGALLVGTTVYAKCVKAPGSGFALMGTDRSVTSDAQA